MNTGRIWRRIKILFKSIQQLGLRRVGLFGLHRLGILSGYYRWRFSSRSLIREAPPLQLDAIRSFIPGNDPLPPWLTPEIIAKTVANADEILHSRYRLFGGPAAELILSPSGTDQHWSRLDENDASLGIVDIKQVWESGRFGWAIVLARAYYLSRDERYARGFWEKFELFLHSNPEYYGPNWISAQEVALRLISLTFTLALLEDSEHTTSSRRASAVKYLVSHANRIPATLIYARAQNNNHLLVEAVGLYTAALVFPGHRDAKNWSRLGWYWIHKALQGQIFSDGSYAQHSTNYHRLMLQTALWMTALAKSENRQIPDESWMLLRKAVAWLWSLMDRESGNVPNLGPNDGALILPLSTCAFSDYRPVIQAAGMAFLNQQVFVDGSWNEEAWWLGYLDERRFQEDVSVALSKVAESLGDSPVIIRDPYHDSWAYLRCVEFNSRPGHADQLHFDLWWRGKNIALDAGTYSYNAPRPWNNVLTQADVHNTVTVDGYDQMTRAGKFLYLDWAQCEVPEAGRSEDPAILGYAVGQHGGYRWLGVIHRREVFCWDNGHWVLLDHLTPTNIRNRNAIREYTVRLHWLVLDLPWELNLDSDAGVCEIRLQNTEGMIVLRISRQRFTEDERLAIITPKVEIVRAGEMLYGQGQAPAWRGWRSPTYFAKEPALSISATVTTELPMTLRSDWKLEVG